MEVHPSLNSSRRYVFTLRKDFLRLNLTSFPTVRERRRRRCRPVSVPAEESRTLLPLTRLPLMFLDVTLLTFVSFYRVSSRLASMGYAIPYSMSNIHPSSGLSSILLPLMLPPVSQPQSTLSPMLLNRSGSIAVKLPIAERE